MIVVPGAASPFFRRPGFGDLPVGSVTAFAGALGPPDSSSPAAAASPAPYTTNPLEAWGWMVCDGRSLPCVDYPELFSVLGYVYGGADDNFNIPDYRGYFLRGIGTGTRNDPDIGQRSQPPGGQGRAMVWVPSSLFPCRRTSTPTAVRLLPRPHLPVGPQRARPVSPAR